MGLINTQPFGLMRQSARVEARNAHLMPEIHRRAKRILVRAKEEEIVSVSTVRETVEIWHLLKTGTPCICGKIEKAQFEKEQCENGVPDILEFLHSNNPTIINNHEFCPLCFGSGFIGGAEIQGNYSIMLHANHPDLTLTDGLSVECGYYHNIRVGTEGTATWKVQLPKYFIKCHSIVAHWTPRPPHAFELLLNNKEFDMDTFNLLGQRNKNEPIEISIKIQDTSGEIHLDYIRIILQQNRNNLVMVDSPNPVFSFTGDLQVHSEIQSTVTLNFDGKQKIETTDVVFFEKNGVGYRIFEIEDNSPLGVTISQNTQARLIRSFEKELLYPSKIAHQLYPMENFSFLY